MKRMNVTKKNIEKIKLQLEQEKFCEVEKRIEQITDLETLRSELRIAQKNRGI